MLGQHPKTLLQLTGIARRLRLAPRAPGVAVNVFQVDIRLTGGAVGGHLSPPQAGPSAASAAASASASAMISSNERSLIPDASPASIACCNSVNFIASWAAKSCMDNITATARPFL